VSPPVSHDPPARDPQAKGAVEWLQGYLEANFAPGWRFADRLDLQLQLDARSDFLL